MPDLPFTRRKALQAGGTAVSALFAGCTVVDSDASSSRGTCSPKSITIDPKTWSNARNDPENTNAAPDADIAFTAGRTVEANFQELVPPVGSPDGLYFVERDEDQEIIRAIDTDGGDRWRVAGTLTATEDVPEEYVRQIECLATDGRRIYAGVQFSIPEGDGPLPEPRTGMSAALYALDASDGTVEWVEPAWRPLDLKVDDTGRVYLASYSDANFRSAPSEYDDSLASHRDRRLRVRAFDARTGVECWRYAPQRGFLGQLRGAVAGIDIDEKTTRGQVIDGEYYYLPVMPSGSENGSTEIHVLDKSTGERVREIELPIRVYREMAIVGDTIFFDSDEFWDPDLRSSSSPSINAFELEGAARKWSSPHEDTGVYFLVAASAEAVIAYDYRNRTVALDPANGTETWSVDTPWLGARNRLPLVGGSVIVPTNDEDDPSLRTVTGLQVHDVMTGELLERFEFGTDVRFYGSVVAGEQLYVTLEADENRLIHLAR